VSLLPIKAAISMKILKNAHWDSCNLVVDTKAIITELSGEELSFIASNKQHYLKSKAHKEVYAFVLEYFDNLILGEVYDHEERSISMEDN